MPRTKEPKTDPYREAPTEKVPASNMDPVGVAGVHIASGNVYDEFIPNLLGTRGRRVYREMRDNDATVGAILFAVEMLIRAVTWTVESQDKSAEGTSNADSDFDETDPGAFADISDPEQAVAFLEGMLFDDMQGTWDDFISVVLSMLPFGWQYTEINWKRRKGITEDPMTSSIYDDGMIGVAKLADRSQETLERWDTDDQGTIYGMYQNPPEGGVRRYIPASRAIHFTPSSFKDSPEGRSILRTAYRPWWFLKNTQEIEAIAIERELNGLPVVYIPNDILNGTSVEAKAAKAAYIKMVRDVKFNEQGGLVLPSNTYYDNDGKPTTVKQVEFALMNAGGTRAIDTDAIIKRYQNDISRTILAQFLFLSSAGNKGGNAQSENETDLFLRAVEGWLENIAATINRQLVPKIWQRNGLDPAIMPHVVPGELSPEDLEELGSYVQKLSQAGIVLTDLDTEDYLREAGGLPPAIERNDDNVVFDREGELPPGAVPVAPGTPPAAPPKVPIPAAEEETA